MAPILESFVLPTSRRACPSSSLLHSKIPFFTPSPPPPPTLPGPAPLEEPLNRYVPGGYHPIKLGDIFHGHYNVKRKLGWGVHSTVWLAQDQKLNRHVAMKILTARASMELHELECLRRIRQNTSQHPGHSHVMHLLDHFYFHGPHGTHLCLVSEVLGESVRRLSFKYNRKILPIPFVKQITKQVLTGLDYLHSHDIIHTDLKTDNFLLQLDDVEAMIEKELQGEAPQTFPPVFLGQHLDVTYVKSQPLPMGDIDYLRNLKEVKVKITDLGVSCRKDKQSEYYTDLIQSAALRAPEVELGAGWDERCDTWSMGCNVYEMLAGKPLFPPNLERELHIALMIVTFGDFPADLIRRGKYSSEFFTRGKFFTDIPERLLLADRVNNFFSTVMEEEERGLLNDFLGAMLKLEPSERSSPADLVNHTWLRA